MPKGIYIRTEKHKHCGFQNGHKINLRKPSSCRGRKCSQEHINKVRQSRIGYSHSQETRDKISRAHLGLRPSVETLLKLRNSHLGIPPGNKGKKTPRYIVEKMRRKKLGDKVYEERKRLGILDYRKVWNGYYPAEFIEARGKIYKRDSWRCQKCEYKCDRTIMGKIQCHHIDYNQLNNSSTNLITLCFSCHIKTNSNRGYWKQYFSQIMKGRVAIF